MVKRLGPPDLLLLSGDLTNSGDPKEFKRVDRFLDTLRGWLIAARAGLREKEGFTDRFAWNAFARLALAMVNAEMGKKAVFDLEAGAAAIDPALRRQFPGLTAEERRQEACQYQPRPEITAAYEAALERSMVIFTPEGAARVPVKDRIAVAEGLGRGGDPRLAPDQDNFLAVPGLAGVRLGKYPVTVEDTSSSWRAEGTRSRSTGGRRDGSCA
jgi:hypothetical protein